MQGFSAGGEWGSSTAYIVEWAPQDKRGFYGSFQQLSVVAGLLLGSAVAAIMNTVFTPEQMGDWGWRVPFLLGGILGPVGLWMRRTIDETPAYKKALTAPPAPPSAESGWVMAARAFGFTIVWTVCFYVLLSYMPTYTQKYVKISASAALWANTIGLLVLVIFIPIMGALSDKWGRKPLLLACCIAFIIVPYPVFNFLISGASVTELILVQIGFAILISCFSGAGPAAIAEMFPTRDTLDLDDHRLCARGRDIRRVRAADLGVPDRQIRLAARAHLLPDRRRDRVDHHHRDDARDRARAPRLAHARRIMLITFAGKRVIVAGAARGIGHAHCGRVRREWRRGDRHATGCSRRWKPCGSG